MEIYAYNSFRQYLREFLLESIKSNPAFSLRAFARHLQVDASHLSSVLKGNKSFSKESASKIAQKLSLQNDELDYFILLVEYENAKELKYKERLHKKIVNANPNFVHKNLELDHFKFFTNWFYIPILEMVDLTDFDYTPKSIAKRLGLNVIEVEEAILCLTRLGFLVNECGVYKRSYQHGHFQSDQVDKALRQYHKQMLEKAIMSLEQQLPNEKFSGSQTFSINPKDIDNAKKIIRNCLNDLVHLFKAAKKKTDVYHVEIQLFNITKEMK